MSIFLTLAESEPTSLGVIMAVVAVVMAVVKVFEEVIRYFISELKRKREEAEKANAPSPPSGDGEIPHDCPTGCADCQRRVTEILDLLRGELRTAMQARIDDLTAQRDDYKESAAEATAAVNRLAMAVRDGFSIVPEETDEEDEDAEGG